MDSSDEMYDDSFASEDFSHDDIPVNKGPSQSQSSSDLINSTNSICCVAVAVDAQRKIVKKRAKKVSKFIQAKMRGQLQLKQEQMQALLPHISSSGQYVYVFGDEIIEFDYNLTSFEPSPINKSYFNQFKKIRLVESTQSAIEMTYDNKSKQRSQFQFMIDRFSTSPKKELRDLASTLITFQKFSEVSSMQMQASVAVLSDEVNSSLMVQKQSIFADHCYEWINNNTDEDDFYTYTFFHLDGQAVSLRNQKEGISKSLIALLGGNMDTIHQVALRQGGIHFMNSRSRLDLLHEKVNFLSYFNQDTKEFDFELITFDEIIVPCKVTIRYFEVPICVSPTCQYQVKYNIAAIPWMKFYSSCKLLKFDISPNTILSIIETRQRQDNRLFDQLYEDFEYTTESEVFLEKFYNKKVQKKRNSTICNFRKI